MKQSDLFNRFISGYNVCSPGATREPSPGAIAGAVAATVASLLSLLASRYTLSQVVLSVTAAVMVCAPRRRWFFFKITFANKRNYKCWYLFLPSVGESSNVHSCDRPGSPGSARTSLGTPPAFLSPLRLLGGVGPPPRPGSPYWGGRQGSVSNV